MEIREKQFGDRDLRIVPCCRLMAILLRHLGDFKTAKEMAERGWKIQSTFYENNAHPNLAESLNVLAEVETELQELLYETKQLQSCV